MPTDRPALADAAAGSQARATDHVFDERRRAASDIIRWYEVHGAAARWRGGAMTLMAVFCLAAGGLLPVANDLVSAATQTRLRLEVGYLLLGLGGALLLMDRLLGFSSNWARFLSTALQLRARTDLFAQEWRLAGLDENPERARLELARTFTAELHEIVLKETARWDEELKARLRDAGALRRS